MSSKVLASAASVEVAPVLWRVISCGAAKALPEIPVHEQLEQRFRQGKQQGASEAIAAARKEADAKLEPVMAQLASTVAELAEMRLLLREQAAGDIVHLSIAIAARILHREISLDPDAIQGLVRGALDKLNTHECSRVIVHPAHEASIRRLLSAIPARAGLEIVSDPSLKPGDVRFDTAHGQLDASVETQLREIERGLADRLDA